MIDTRPERRAVWPEGQTPEQQAAVALSRAQGAIMMHPPTEREDDRDDWAESVRQEISAGIDDVLCGRLLEYCGVSVAALFEADPDEADDGIVYLARMCANANNSEARHCARRYIDRLRELGESMAHDKAFADAEIRRIEAEGDAKAPNAGGEAYAHERT